MNTIALTADLLVKLAPLKEATTLTDLDGKVIGTYTPTSEGKTDEYERIKSLFDLEEAERDFAIEQPLYTTEQVLEHLRSLGNEK